MLSGLGTLREIEEDWSLEDVLLANAALDYRLEVQRVAAKTPSKGA